MFQFCVQAVHFRNTQTTLGLYFQLGSEFNIQHFYVSGHRSSMWSDKLRSDYFPIRWLLKFLRDRKFERHSLGWVPHLPDRWQARSWWPGCSAGLSAGWAVWGWLPPLPEWTRQGWRGWWPWGRLLSVAACWEFEEMDRVEFYSCRTWYSWLLCCAKPGYVIANTPENQQISTDKLSKDLLILFATVYIFMTFWSLFNFL